MKQLLFFVIGLGCAVLTAQEPPSTVSRATPPLSGNSTPSGANDPGHAFVEISEKHIESLQKGLDWLVRSQNKDGSFGTRYPVAVTSLACLSLMANGSMPNQGPYQQPLTRGIRYLMDRQTRTGLFAEPNGKLMHSHGYATMFLAELYGTQIGQACRGGISELKYRLKKAVRVIERSQSGNGGWYYSFDPDSDEGSVTVTMVQAMRAARNAGIQVNEQAVKKAFEYVRKSSNEDGSIAYSLHERSSSYALTAAGVSVLNFLGEYKGKEVDRGMDYLMKSMEKDPSESGRTNFAFYEDFYATLSFYHAGGKLWELYYPRIRDVLIKTQKEDGCWESSYGGEYGTAFSLLILQVPYRYLPILQR